MGKGGRRFWLTCSTPLVGVLRSKLPAIAGQQMEKQADGWKHLDQPSPPSPLSPLLADSQAPQSQSSRPWSVKRLKEKGAKGARKGESCPCLAKWAATAGSSVQGYRPAAGAQGPAKVNRCPCHLCLGEEGTVGAESSKGRGSLCSRARWWANANRTARCWVLPAPGSAPSQHLAVLATPSILV